MKVWNIIRDILVVIALIGLITIWIRDREQTRLLGEHAGHIGRLLIYVDQLQRIELKRQKPSAVPDPVY